MKTEKKIKQRLAEVKEGLSFHQFIFNDEKSTNEEKNGASDMINFYEIEIDVLNWILI
jgi:hypothetical protein